jgi:2,4-dienoyl-CoA reductase (NADPH2)
VFLGIGWHEARVPTIGTMVPRGAFTWVTQKLKGEVSLPLCTTNRINTPEVAEDILGEFCGLFVSLRAKLNILLFSASGHADLVSMARPLLADPFFVQKARLDKADEINTCIGCNQACLDQIFMQKHASCLVNPRAANETTLHITPVQTKDKRNIAVVGAGPAGLATAATAAMRGHNVTLFEKDSKIGGQFNMAKLIPGKEEFHETLRYFGKQLEINKVCSASIDLMVELLMVSLFSG